MSTRQQQTETEQLIAQAQKTGLVQAPLTVRGVLITSVLQATLGTVLFNQADWNGSSQWVAILGLILMFLGVAGTLMYSSDLMKVDRRNRALRKALPHDKR